VTSDRDPHPIRSAPWDRPGPRPIDLAALIDVLTQDEGPEVRGWFPVRFVADPRRVAILGDWAELRSPGGKSPAVG
jgi:hypothetical protein